MSAEEAIACLLAARPGWQRLHYVGVENFGMKPARDLCFCSPAPRLRTMFAQFVLLAQETAPCNAEAKGPDRFAPPLACAVCFFLAHYGVFPTYLHKCPGVAYVFLFHFVFARPTYPGVLARSMSSSFTLVPSRPTCARQVSWRGVCLLLASIPTCASILAQSMYSSWKLILNCLFII